MRGDCLQQVRHEFERLIRSEVQNAEAWSGFRVQCFGVRVVSVRLVMTTTTIETTKCLGFGM